MADGGYRKGGEEGKVGRRVSRELAYELQPTVMKRIVQCSLAD